MTLSFTLPHRLLRAFGIALMCAVPVAHAAELEGTVVTLDTPGSASAAAKSAPLADTPVAPDEPAPATEQASLATDAGPWQNHNNWERDWEKNLGNVFGSGHEGTNGFHPALLITLFVIVFIFGGPVILLILILVFFFGAKRRRQQDINMNIDKLLAAGRDIPVELLRGDEAKGADDTGNQAKGIRNICLGAGWLVFLTIAFSIEIGAIGFIWIGLGLSQVLIWYLNKPTVSEQAGQQD